MYFCTKYHFMIKLSAFVITYNEEAKIADCISSLKQVADEIVVVDSYSTDKTVEICEQHGVKVHLREFKGYYDQKKWATEATSHQWVLNLDADEVLSSQLVESINEFKKNPNADACSMNRFNFYCGRWIKHSSWYPDTKIRLWNKEKAGWTGVNIHEKVELNDGAKLRHLKGDILHTTFENINQHIAQTVKFTDISAKESFEKGRKISTIKLLFAPLFKFLYCYIIRLGFLDGKQGFMISIMNSFSGFIKYVKIQELHKKNKNKTD